MASLRPLRGGCHCGRNNYTINLPENCADVARVLFDTDPRHRIVQASPLSAFLRVPLSWYHSSTSAFFPDEASWVIRRTYTHPSQEHAKHGFCGFCGTPLSYWSEDPPGEADFIRLTLGSLCSEDLGELEDLGLLPGSSDDGEAEEGQEEDGGAAKAEGAAQGSGKRGNVSRQAISPSTSDRGARLVSPETLGVPWFKSMVAGSRLGSLRTSRVGAAQSHDGRVRCEWEVVEWTSGGSDDGRMADNGGQPSPTKRPKHDVGEGAGNAASL